MAVEECVWIVDVLTLRSLARTTSQQEKETELWTAFLRQLLCSDAIKLGSSSPCIPIHHISLLQPPHTSGFSIRGDLRSIGASFPEIVNAIRRQAKGIICLYASLSHVRGHFLPFNGIVSLIAVIDGEDPASRVGGQIPLQPSIPRHAALLNVIPVLWSLI